MSEASHARLGGVWEARGGVWELQELQPLTKLWGRMGPLMKLLTRVWEESGRLPELKPLTKLRGQAGPLKKLLARVCGLGGVLEEFGSRGGA